MNRAHFLSNGVCNVGGCRDGAVVFERSDGRVIWDIDVCVVFSRREECPWENRRVSGYDIPTLCDCIDVER
jgi:hypothetical protein